jgi:ketosteroid isomerase-like protein
MSQENVELVRRLFDGWEQGDWAAGRDLFADECEVVFGTSAFPDADTYAVGRDALSAWMRWLDAFETFAIGLEEIVDVGERVVALAWLRGRGRTSGADVDAQVGTIFTFRDGTIVRYELVNRRQALEAAGLSE